MYIGSMCLSHCFIFAERLNSQIKSMSSFVKYFGDRAYSECFMYISPYTTNSIYMYLHCWIALHLTSFCWLHVASNTCLIIRWFSKQRVLLFSSSKVYTGSLAPTLRSSCCIDCLFFFLWGSELPK